MLRDDDSNVYDTQIIQKSPFLIINLAFQQVLPNSHVICNEAFYVIVTFLIICVLFQKRSRSKGL
jgi:hypothetical protein